MKKSFFVITLLLAGIAVFELHPAVEQARNIVPEDIYIKENCQCDCILASRPWYSTVNYWLWFWVFAVPALVFSLKAGFSRWQKAAYLSVIVLICYSGMNLAAHLMWDIRNGPFIVNPDPDFPDQRTWDMADCANIADGASRVFFLFLGWIPAGLYVGLWLLIRKVFQRSSKALSNCEL